MMAGNLSVWLQTYLGGVVLSNEKRSLQPHWENVRGDLLLFVGDSLQAELARAYHFSRMITVSCLDQQSIDTYSSNTICANYDELPIAQASMSAVFLPHILEFSKAPKKVLTEAKAVLQPEGTLIIVGFNPFSLFGLRKMFSRRKKAIAPWSGKFRSLWKLKKWLREMNFDTVNQSYTFYDLPINNGKTLKWLKWFKWISWVFKFCAPMVGGIYIISARKKTLGITPVKMKWQKIQEVVGNTMAKPVTRRSAQ
jgi:hypothetical protein